MISLTKKEKRYSSRLLGKDICVSNDTRVTKLNSNDLVIGGSGAGKTGSYVIPLLQSLNDQESIIVSDTKNQLYNLFKDDLKKRGFSVSLIDFANPTNSNVGYNPLSLLRDGKMLSKKSERDIVRLADILADNSPQNGIKDDPIWRQSSSSWIAFFIAFLFAKDAKAKHTMYDVVDVFNRFTSPAREKYFEPVVSGKNSGTFVGKKYHQILSMADSDRTFASIVFMVQEALGPLP